MDKYFIRKPRTQHPLRNQMGDQGMNDCLVVYIERDITYSIDNETIMQ